MVWYFEVSGVTQDQLAGAGKGSSITGVPDYEKANNGPRLVVLDDILNKTSRDVCDLLRKGSYHRNTSAILITH
jgi:hypothetical protein